MPVRVERPVPGEGPERESPGRSGTPLRSCAWPGRIVNLTRYPTRPPRPPPCSSGPLLSARSPVRKPIRAEPTRRMRDNVHDRRQMAWPGCGRPTTIPRGADRLPVPPQLPAARKATVVARPATKGTGGTASHGAGSMFWPGTSGLGSGFLTHGRARVLPSITRGGSPVP